MVGIYQLHLIKYPGKRSLFKNFILFKIWEGLQFWKWNVFEKFEQHIQFSMGNIEYT